VSPPILTIDILRHGETAMDAGKLYGSTDVPLSNLGKEQLLKAAKKIHQEPIAHIVSSPLQRCAWLAEQLRDKLAVTYARGFAEMDFGNWEGQDIKTLLKKEPNFRRDVSQISPPNGESFLDFHQRVLTTWDKYIAANIETGGHHLLVAHGGVIRVLLGKVLHIPTQHLGNLFIPYAAWSRITFVQGEPPMLWFMNHHA